MASKPLAISSLHSRDGLEKRNEMTDETTKKSIGRPRKAAVASKKKGNRGKRGRPPGDAAIINEYKARMLASPKSRLVLEKIFDAALDDEHKHQSAAWKLIADRVLPVSAFEQDIKKSGGTPQVVVTIQGIEGNVSVGKDEEPLEGEFESTDD
jgi:hypothetical protein